MGKLFDFLLSGFDLQIKDGDFVTGESTLQNVQVLLLAEKGDFKQSPTVGVGLINSIEDDKNTDELAADIQSELENDGATITTLSIPSFDNIQIAAEYDTEDNSLT